MVYSGLKSGGILVANSPYPFKEKPHQNLRRTSVLDATTLAVEVLGMPAVSTCMIGSLAAATHWVSLSSILTILPDYFNGKVLERNIRCAERGYCETQVVEW
jgi:Pyruvate/2-oxoacid:ferredoxin oxidoreductase gamma subunit